MKQLFLIFISLFLASCGQNLDNRMAIAILTPVTHPSLEQIEKGFKEEIEALHPGKYRFTTYNAQGNKTLMRSEIEEISNKEFALVFTIGTSASQMTKEVFEMKQLEIPIVFTCVNDPVGFNIIVSEESPGGHVTGVKEMLRFEEELAALLKLKPEIKKVMLVYNPMEPGLQKDQAQVERILKENNISLKTVEVFQTNEMLAKVSPFVSQMDALIVLKDNTVVSGLEVLVKICDRHQVPLMASDLDSPDRGAAFGFGVHEIDFGIEGARKAHQILVEGEKPGNIPVTPISNFTLRVNTEAAKKQGVNLP